MCFKIGFGEEFFAETAILYILQISVLNNRKYAFMNRHSDMTIAAYTLFFSIFWQMLAAINKLAWTI
jgi:hypothetical protein